ncbi:MAG: Gfo/Idh/MocA family oxidoreductase [Massilibacteroides sp.]|nr:Gfo/Idh/MocA family oxidoreductase [Massilibacteroides sp.]
MMKNNKKKNMNRRDFLGLSALGLAGLTILPSWAINGVRIAPSDRVVLGFIGLGRQGLSDFRGFSACPGVQVAACCDVDSIKRDRFELRVGEWQNKIGQNTRCDKYEFYEDLLDRKDIDAVEVVTPDHWHAMAAINACQAGKDVYCQKPLTYTIAESLAMVRAVRENSRVLQVGSQQRSSKEFQQAITLIRSGKLGHVDTVYCQIGEPPAPFDLKEFKVPPHLNFNQWLGPLNSEVVHYNPEMCPQIATPMDHETGPWATWRYYRETGNGYTGDWGAHMIDIAQAAIGMDGSGPVEIIPGAVDGARFWTLKYANGIIMKEHKFSDDVEDGDKGLCFNCTNGWLKVKRGYIECSDPSLLQKSEKKIEAGQFEVSAPHMQNFIDSVRSRRNPIAPVEVGASTCIACCLINISVELGRSLKWDPATVSFDGGDEEAKAHRLYKYAYRNPYKLPYCRN